MIYISFGLTFGSDGHLAQDTRPCSVRSRAPFKSILVKAAQKSDVVLTVRRHVGGHHGGGTRWRPTTGSIGQSSARYLAVVGTQKARKVVHQGHVHVQHNLGGTCTTPSRFHPGASKTTTVHWNWPCCSVHNWWKPRWHLECPPKKQKNSLSKTRCSPWTQAPLKPERLLDRVPNV